MNGHHIWKFETKGGINNKVLVIHVINNLQKGVWGDTNLVGLGNHLMITGLVILRVEVI